MAVHSPSPGPRRPAARRRVHMAAAALAVGSLLAGCGLQPAASYVPKAEPGIIKPAEGLPDDASLVVTAKNYTEALTLGKMAVLAATAAGFKVTDLSNVPGSQPFRDLLVSGKADMGWDYTGTGWIIYMGHEEGIPDKGKQWQAVHDEDLGNGLTWGEPSPENNTYSFAVRKDAVKKLGGISKMSQIAKLPVKDRTFCVESEFNSRSDGFNPWLKAYGMKRGAANGVPDDNIGIYDTGAVYSATANGDCNFGEVFTTDGRIDALDLVVLEDDRKFFPAYNLAPVISTETLEEYPQLADVFEEVSSRLNDEVMRGLNLKVDVNGEEPADVAYDWMVSEGLITEPQ
ncbi:glycine betaine ABC transporter substrate-binding protein [Arthrobacter rhombi]